MDYVWSALGYNTATNGAGPAAESVAVPPAPAAEGESERPDWTKMMTGGCPVSVPESVSFHVSDYFLYQREGRSTAFGPRCVERAPVCCMFMVWYVML